MKWCSFCNDSGGPFVLCVGCRLTLCIYTTENPNGCLGWDPKILDTRFVFDCPYCVEGPMQVSTDWRLLHTRS